jgi:hypothetical protein
MITNPSLTKLSAFVAKVDAKLLVIDTLMRFIRISDICDYVAVTLALEPLVDLARKGISILIVHHTAKANFADINDAALGSTALTGSCDGMINLIRRGDSVSMSSRQRYSADYPETYLEFDSETRALKLGSLKAESEIDRVSQGISTLLNNADGFMTEAEIEDKVTGATLAKRRGLRQLVEQGKVQRTGLGGKREPYMYGINRHI